MSKFILEYGKIKLVSMFYSITDKGNSNVFESYDLAQALELRKQLDEGISKLRNYEIGRLEQKIIDSERLIEEHKEKIKTARDDILRIKSDLELENAVH